VHWYREVEAQATAHAATIEQLEQRVVAAEEEASELRHIEMGLVMDNGELGDLLGEVLAKLRIACELQSWPAILGIKDRLEHAAGPAAPPLGVASQGEEGPAHG
jgi:hypothetical protein